jgi:hypothetical protein
MGRASTVTTRCARSIARSRNGVGGLPRRFRARFAAAALPLLLAACAATETPESVQPNAPGFLLGVWHGFIFPVAWIISLFSDKVAIFGHRPKFTLSACLAGSRRAVPNNGGWYDFGYVIGIMVFGVGAKGGHSFAVHKR